MQLATTGREEEVEWEISDGEVLDTENPRHLQVKYEEPGVYSVTSKLSVDGDVIRQRSVNVLVQPLT